MQDDDENADERGALLLRPDSPRRDRFTLLVSDSFCFAAKAGVNPRR